MTPDRARWLLAHPLNDAEGAVDPAYRDVIEQPDGALLTAVLAVDR